MLTYFSHATEANHPHVSGTQIPMTTYIIAISIFAVVLIATVVLLLSRPKQTIKETDEED